VIPAHLDGRPTAKEAHRRWPGFKARFGEFVERAAADCSAEQVRERILFEGWQVKAAATTSDIGIPTTSTGR